MNNVLITGSTGFIGSHITRFFCEKNVTVSCLVRNNSDVSNISGLPIEIINGDITDFSSLTNSFKGFDCVIHNAAYVRDWGAYKVFYKANVEGTLNVIKACYECGINNIIMTGSNSIFGEDNNNLVKNEESPHNSHYRYFADRVFPSKLNYYRDTKALAVSEATEFCSSKNINLTILSPVWVYGEREFNTGFYEYVKTAQSGIPALPGSKRNKFHVIYAKDLARAYYLAYEKKLQGINSIIIGNSETQLMEKIYLVFCSEAGIDKPLNLPKAITYPIGFVLELFYTLMQIKKPPSLTRGRVNMFYDNIEYSTIKAEKMLGFKNEYSLEQGIQETIKWYKEMKLL